MPENDIAVWYANIPVVSKYWFTGSVILPLLNRMGILSAWWLILEYTLFFKKFQVKSLSFFSTLK